MVSVGADPGLHAGIGFDSAVDPILQGYRRGDRDLDHPALCCRGADGHCKVSPMRQQFSYAERIHFVLAEMPLLRASSLRRQTIPLKWNIGLFLSP